VYGGCFSRDGSPGGLVVISVDWAKSRSVHVKKSSGRYSKVYIARHHGRSCSPVAERFQLFIVSLHYVSFP
jgi:hypothetical protein